MYNPELTKTMEEELTAVGIKALKAPQDVDAAINTGKTIMIVINSVCGCSAASLRPSIKLALTHDKIPEASYTVFAGVDMEATQQVRSHIDDRPSSPSVAIFKNNELAFFLPRHGIEGRTPREIATDLEEAFDKLA